MVVRFEKLPDGYRFASADAQGAECFGSVIETRFQKTDGQMVVLVDSSRSVVTDEHPGQTFDAIWFLPSQIDIAKSPHAAVPTANGPVHCAPGDHRVCKDMVFKDRPPPATGGAPVSESAATLTIRFIAAGRGADPRYRARGFRPHVS